MPSVAATVVVLPDRILEDAVVEHDAGRVVDIRPATGPVPDRVLCPGFVDIQVNGHDDIDVATAEGAAWERLDELLLAQGVTAWCPTLVTAPLDRIDRALDRIGEAMRRSPAPRPRILGAHLEGPFLGGAPGAHRTEYLRDPDLEWLAALPGHVRIVTLAPEREGAFDAIRLLTGRDVTVSLGHSTATYDQAVAAITAGARLVTHLFNGMVPLHHREPGLVGAGLSDDRLCASMIADGIHLHPAALKAAMAAKGRGRAVLVTDAVGWRARQHAGFPVELGGDPPAPRLPDGTLAGSNLTMDAALRTCVAAGIPLLDAVHAATTAPAALLRGVRASLEVGAVSDLVLLTADLHVEDVVLAA